MVYIIYQISAKIIDLEKNKRNYYRPTGLMSPEMKYGLIPYQYFIVHEKPELNMMSPEEGATPLRINQAVK